MAKYSKEQRDRAVDLYIKYERCAAIVVRGPARGGAHRWIGYDVLDSPMRDE